MASRKNYARSRGIISERTGANRNAHEMKAQRECARRCVYLPNTRARALCSRGVDCSNAIKYYEKIKREREREGVGITRAWCTNTPGATCSFCSVDAGGGEYTETDLLRGGRAGRWCARTNKSLVIFGQCHFITVVY